MLNFFFQLLFITQQDHIHEQLLFTTKEATQEIKMAEVKMMNSQRIQEITF